MSYRADKYVRLFICTGTVIIISMIYLAADHRGFLLKEEIKRYLLGLGVEVKDAGPEQLVSTDDYVDYAEAACVKIVKNTSLHKGILLCGSGHGLDMVANKYKGIRAALCFNEKVAVQSREHENTNVLILASDWVKAAEAKAIIKVWLETKFTGEERHVRRLKKIEKIEERNFK